MTVMIVAGGAINEKFTRGFIGNMDESPLFIIACDKGFISCENMGLTPNLVIGDFDSAGMEAFERAKKSCNEVVKLNPVKDDTDTEAALRIAFERTDPKDSIYLLGATGTRLDHVMGSIGLLGMGLQNGRKVILVDSHNYIEMIDSTREYAIEKQNQFGKYVSVLPYMGEVTGLTMKGYKYSVDNITIQGFNTLTVSNEIVDPVATIKIKSGYLIVMQSKD